jgi:hypothetical protein
MVHRGVDPSLARIDPEQCVVIADLLFLEKMKKLLVPIVLDYRRNSDCPSVFYYPDDAFESYWCQKFPCFDRFCSALDFPVT